ncbi:hypothetical protein [Gorillibacterium massiliense]|uniref:hypothetical protein n=1 Tax=Gorillibacterium massiliense TaxID=1280390 RepID=UPI0004B9A332|nr:hypothetical protein [Gorillibacterium massiliense]
MDTQLIQDTISMLEETIDPDALISLDADESGLADMVALLHSYEITRSRKMTILGCYILLQAAVSKHHEASPDESGAMTRSILDGDYLFGLYFRILVQFSELKLLTYLAPVQKKIQLGLIAGKPMAHILTELHEPFRLYLNEQCA